LASASPKDDRVVATTRSAASTISQPPAVARPVDRDDDRLLAVAVGEPGEPATFGVQRGTRSGVDRLQVGAGAEDGTLLALGVGLDDADPDLVVGSIRSMAASIAWATSPLTALRASGD
jgi:hypothetical protein